MICQVRESVRKLSLDGFTERYYKYDASVVLCGCTESWGVGVKALATEEGLRHYFGEVHGHRTVPVEIWQPVRLTGVGTEEAEGGLEERLMTLREFTDSHLLPEPEPEPEPDGPVNGSIMIGDGMTVAYLAQHALFDQIPALWGLVRVFPWVNVGGGGSGLLHANVWLGEGGTITGLHFDSYDNFLLQLHGYKYVRLYDKSETKHLYRIPAAAKRPAAKDEEEGNGGAAMRPKKQKSGGTAAQGNLSRIGRAIEQDGVEGKFPALKDATYTEAVLGPGDALYIPAGVWHYVRSLETSLSVNYWF